jgi:hypothetical protein
VPRSLAALFASRSEQLAAQVPRYAWRAACSASGPALRTFNPAELPVSQFTKVELTIKSQDREAAWSLISDCRARPADEAIE